MKRLLYALCRFVLSAQLFAYDGLILVLNKLDNTVSILDDNGKLIKTLTTGVGPHEIAVSPNGRLAAFGNYGDQFSVGNSIGIIDLNTLEVVKTIDISPNTRPHGLKFLTNDELIVSAEAQQAILHVSISEEKVLKTITTKQQASHMVVINRKDQMAYTANILPGTVSKMNIKVGTHEAIFQASKGIEGIGISPDGKEVWVANRETNKVMVLDSGSGEITHTLEAGTLPFRVEFSPDGKYVVVPNPVSSDLSLYDANSKKLLKNISLKRNETGQNPGPVGLIVDDKSEYIYVNCQNIGSVVKVSLSEQKMVDVFKVGNGPDGIAYAAK